jgi:flavorubredoxin
MIPLTLPTTPQQIAPDSWLIPTLAAEPSGAFFGAHSLVITGREPIVVDTGCSLVRDQWAASAFAVVDPADVRWIFISHDDHDHIGNLPFVLEQCPNATLVCSFSIVSRLAGDVELPLERMRWVDGGGSFDAGDRILQVVRPPMFDSPATRGLFDPATGLLWAADSFGTFFPGEAYEADDIPADLYDATFELLNAWNTPWLEWVDVDRFGAHVATTAELPLRVVASAHGPVHRGARIADAFRRTLELAGRPVAATPGQEVLDQMLSTVFTAA